MADWNPSLYLQFASERTRPAAELLARIAKPTAKHIADLGCGPGNSTELLHDVWPDAVITGVDNSPAMLEKAQQALPDCQFVNANISEWQPEQPLDVLYANASLQWVADHQILFPRLASLLAADGVPVDTTTLEKADAACPAGYVLYRNPDAQRVRFVVS